MTALQQLGADVARVNMEGFPDLVVHWRGVNHLVEVIGAAKAAKYRKTGGLTPAQVRFHRDWRGTIHKVRNVSEAFRAIGAEVAGG